MIEIKSARVLDAVPIMDLLNYNIKFSTINFDYGEKNLEEIQNWLERKKDTNYPVFIATHSGHFAGYATYGPFRTWDGYKYSVEHSIYTHPDFQRKGIGKALIEHLIEDAKLKGFKTMVGCIDASNINSLHFHLKYGFETVGTFKKIGYKFDRWLDCVFVQTIF